MQTNLRWRLLCWAVVVLSHGTKMVSDTFLSMLVLLAAGG